MIDRMQIQAFTSNFPNLQGLKQIPISLGLLMIIMWDELQDSASRDLSLPILIFFSMAILYWFVDRYYRLAYGAVRQKGEKRTREILVSVMAGVLALACFILESAFNFLFSPLGILLALSLVFDGIRVKRALPGRSFPFFWIFALVLGAASLLPLLGLAGWWEQFGLHTQLGAVLVLAGMIMFFTGFLWHMYLVRNLRTTE